MKKAYSHLQAQKSGIPFASSNDTLGRFLFYF